jgi:uncharacterized membrane-anchored protein YitT (DUF2179 family)
MTFLDWSIDIVLLLLVVLQIRGRRLGIVQLLLPLALVGIAVWHYAQTLPTTTNGQLLIVLGPLVGLVLGLLAGAFTRVWNRDGTPFAKATLVAAGFWVLGMGFRLAFQIWASSSAGGADLQTFSLQHQIQESAWVDGLLLMAVGEVVGRTVLLFVRGRVVAARRGAAVAAA